MSFRLKQPKRISLGKVADISKSFWRPTLFAVLTVAAALTGLLLRPHEERVPPALPGGIGVAVNRPHVNGVVVIAVDEHSGPKGQTSLTVEPYLRADDGKPILVAVVIYGKIAITDYFHGKVS